MKIDIGKLTNIRIRAGSSFFGSVRKRTTGKIIHYQKCTSATLFMDFEAISEVYISLTRRQARQLEQSLRKLLLIKET